MDPTHGTAEIRTEFDNRAYVPGEILRGKVSWLVAETPRTVELRLFYYTAGKGTQDVGVVEEQTFDGPNSEDEEAFEFKLPEGPYSFSGKLVSVIWALELVIGDGEVVERQEFTLSPTGQEIDLYRHATEDMPEYNTIRFGKRKERGDRAK